MVIITVTVFDVHHKNYVLREDVGFGTGIARAANAFAVVFGWLYALIVLLFLELANKIFFYIRKWLGKTPD